MIERNISRNMKHRSIDKGFALTRRKRNTTKISEKGRKITERNKEDKVGKLKMPAQYERDLFDAELDLEKDNMRVKVTFPERPVMLLN